MHLLKNNQFAELIIALSLCMCECVCVRVSVCVSVFVCVGVNVYGRAINDVSAATPERRSRSDDDTPTFMALRSSSLRSFQSDE